MMTLTIDSGVTYYIHPHPAFTEAHLEDGPHLCIHCMPNRDTPATHFVQDDRGWLMPLCERHYQESRP